MVILWFRIIVMKCIWIIVTTLTWIKTTSIWIIVDKFLNAVFEYYWKLKVLSFSLVTSHALSCLTICWDVADFFLNNVLELIYENVMYIISGGEFLYDELQFHQYILKCIQLHTHTFWSLEINVSFVYLRTQMYNNLQCFLSSIFIPLLVLPTFYFHLVRKFVLTALSAFEAEHSCPAGKRSCRKNILVMQWPFLLSLLPLLLLLLLLVLDWRSHMRDLQRNA